MNAFLAKVGRSWTLLMAAFLATAGVFESQFSLLKPYLGEKTWGALYFTGLVLIALARWRTLK